VNASYDRSQLTLWACIEDEAVNPSNPTAERSSVPARPAEPLHPARGTEELWEQLLSKANLYRALQRVEQNGGTPGTDGMGVKELRSYLKTNWPTIRQQLDSGTYQPQPVLRVSIPKPGGGVRELGVPTVMDRLIQQAISQVLTPIFDPHLSETSFGFRPKRSAHMAVETARRYIEEGYSWVVNVDLDRFFDRVNHDTLMARVARKVEDKKLLKLIRAHLNVGVVMAEGVRVVATKTGTPQGSPLSPLLSNIMLDELDKELERRGHRFVRYADDIHIYLKSERAAQRVLKSASALLEGWLKLKVNCEKSGVAPATKRGLLLGFGFFRRKGKVKVRIDKKAIKALKARIRRLTSRSWGVSMEVRINALNKFIRGWCAYFWLAETPSIFARFDEWLRRRLRQVRWKEWKQVRTKWLKLHKHGIPYGKAREWANSRKGSWRVAGSYILARALPNMYWTDLGLRGFGESYGHMRENWRTA
jgi:RNA-directed DNA polymerase